MIVHVILQCRRRLYWIIHLKSFRETLLRLDIPSGRYIEPEVNKDKTQEVCTVHSPERELNPRHAT
jgi:hypothetical protein